MVKQRTTINIDDALLDDVHDSGVRNFSGYIVRLIKQDLKALSRMSKREAKNIHTLEEELDKIREEWKNHVEKKKVSEE